MKRILISVLALLVIVLVVLYFYKDQAVEIAPEVETAQVSNPLNITYVVDGESFVLVDGSAENEIAAGSATKNKLSVFGEPSYGDIDGDGDDDAVLLLVNEPGGSGTFYYAAIAVNTDGTYKATDAILLGDRIAPQTFAIEGGKAVVNYAVRNSEEDFSVQPSVGKSLYLQVDPEALQLILVATDFEGEASSEVMTLDMKEWTWIKATYSDGTEVTPDKADAFTLTFTDDGSVAVSTDCNTMGGSYTVDANNITFGPMFATKMFCEDSQEQVFASMLEETESFLFTSRGELVLELKLDTGSVIFR